MWVPFPMNQSGTSATHFDSSGLYKHLNGPQSRPNDRQYLQISLISSVDLSANPLGLEGGDATRRNFAHLTFSPSLLPKTGSRPSPISATFSVGAAKTRLTGGLRFTSGRQFLRPPLGLIGYANVLPASALPSIVPPVFQRKDNPDSILVPPYSFNNGRYLCAATEISAS